MSYVQEPGGDATNGEETLTQHSWFMGRKEKKIRIRDIYPGHNTLILT